MPDLIDTKLQKPGNQLSGRLLIPGDNRYAVATAVPNALDSAYADRKAELLRWLIEEGRFAPDTGCLLEMLCEKLTGLGDVYKRQPIIRFIQHWKRYGRVVQELSRFSDRELADIGIARCDIDRIASG